MRKFLVRCSYEIVVELPDTTDPIFYIEDNHCPGTGSMGLVLEETMENCKIDDHISTCWACKLNGKNEIIREIR